MGNRRKTYILDVICNRFYFGEVQEDVLGQCSEQGILAPRKESLSVYQWSAPEKKTSRVVEEMHGNTPLRFLGLSWKNTPLKFLGLSWKFWKN